MATYRDNHTQLLAALGQAAQDKVDTEEKERIAREALTEACAAKAAAANAFIAASNAYRNARWSP